MLVNRYIHIGEENFDGIESLQVSNWIDLANNLNRVIWMFIYTEVSVAIVVTYGILKELLAINVSVVELWYVYNYRVMIIIHFYDARTLHMRQ